MRFNYWNLGHCDSGDVVVVTLTGNAANVRLLDSSNFQNYKAGRRHNYHGGLITQSPARIPVPHGGTWYVATDMQGLRGQSRVGVQVIPRAATQPLPPYQPPSLAPIAQAMAEQPPEPPPTGQNVDTKDYDVFISHAGEDKDEIVRPLAIELRTQGLSVWYDEFELMIGDSLRRKIDAGIAQSRFGIVVLSVHFFAKGWPNYELDGIVTMNTSGKQGILPIWHKLTKAEVAAQSPTLADKIARNTTDFTIEEIATEIAQVIQRQKQSIGTEIP